MAASIRARGNFFAADRQIDPNTGTIRIAGAFPNADFLLRPGQYARIRPIVAIVISILTVIVGLVVMFQLPVAQYPKIVPPEGRITTSFVGADAQTVEQAVAAPIEQQMSGVDNLNYMYSIMREISHTVWQALLLVVFVVFIFLQGWRPTLIPLLAVPVSLIGTFIFFPAFGFSINTLSLFGLVLAIIGLAAKNAILIVEFARMRRAHGMTVIDAALEARACGCGRS
jgi:multidrug efflux pump subunit AcrB